MKLVMAIMGKEDAGMVMDALAEEHVQVTRLSTTGGFLRSGNSTLIIGIEDARVGKVINAISKYSSKRTQLMPSALPFDVSSYASLPFKVTVGGATIFVLDVDRFEKV